LPAQHEAQVYAKRDDSPDLRPYRERLLAMGAALASVEHPHAWPVQRVYESERAAFLLRQYMHANLAQRITTRPFLTLVEKVGLAAQVHSVQHPHRAAHARLPSVLRVAGPRAGCPHHPLPPLIPPAGPPSSCSALDRVPAAAGIGAVP
jgi:hypothetical protein